MVWIQPFEVSQLNVQGGVDVLYSVLAEHVRPPALLDFWHFSSVLNLIILEDPVRAQPGSWSKDSWGSPMSPPHPHQCNFLLFGALQIPVFSFPQILSASLSLLRPLFLISVSAFHTLVGELSLG